MHKMPSMCLSTKVPLVNQVMAGEGWREENNQPKKIYNRTVQPWPSWKSQDVKRLYFTTLDEWWSLPFAENDWMNGEVFHLPRMTGGRQLHFGGWSDLTTCPRHPSLMLLWQGVHLINTQRSDPYQSNSFPNGLPHTFLKTHSFCHILLSTMFLSFAANHRVIAVHASKGHRLHNYSTTFLPSHQMATKQNSTTNNKKEHVASLSEKKIRK